MKRQKYAVIVVAEGCGDTIISSAAGTDAGGNKVLADVGTETWGVDMLTSGCQDAGLLAVMSQYQWKLPKFCFKMVS